MTKIDVKIIGELQDGYDNSENDYRKVMAELQLICAKYDLELKTNED